MPPDLPIRIGYNRDFRPFAFERGGEAAGLAIDRTRATLAGAGLGAEFIALALPDMFDGLLAGKVNMLAGTGMAPSRADQLDFSAALVATGGAWFPRADTDWPEDVALAAGGGQGLRVVTPAVGPLARHIETTYPQLALKTCADYGDALAQVAAGAAEAAALNFHVGCDLVAGDDRYVPPASTFLQMNLALAVPAGDPGGLLARLDPHVPPLETEGA